MRDLQSLLDESAARHSHLCPRQVLGVRMGMLAGKALNLDLPQTEKRLFTFVETDGCGAGGISVATGCWVERRTMRVMDFGKMAATFVDMVTMTAVRVFPNPESRINAIRFAGDCADRWQAQLEAYQVMPDEDLLAVQPVSLNVSLEKIISRPGLHIRCEQCGEEIMNEREIVVNGRVLCRYCAGEAYYTVERAEVAPQSKAYMLDMLPA